jgi:hypothetical protein
MNILCLLPILLTAQVETTTATDIFPSGSWDAQEPEEILDDADAPTEKTGIPTLIPPKFAPELVAADVDEEPSQEIEDTTLSPEDMELTSDDFFQFSDFVNSMVTFAVGNKNVFAGPGERIGDTSGYRIGVDRDFNLFLENVDTRYSGFESLSRLVLYKKMPALWKNGETEAALAALVLLDDESGQFRFFDSGTYLRIVHKLAEGEERDTGSIDLTAWPVSADRFRLGYTYIISWGGTSIFPGKLQSSSITEGAVPGLRVRWRAPHGKAYAYAGFKSALLLQRDPGERAGERVPNYGGLIGGGYDFLDFLFVETNGGIFQKGTQQRDGVEGLEIQAYGASTRLTLYEGKRPKPSNDYRLYRNDPTTPINYSLWRGFDPQTSYSVSLEASMLSQNLEDPDFFGSERLVQAVSAGIVAKSQLDHLHLRFDAFYQSPDFILFNVPGFVPFQATPAEAVTTPEFFSAVTVQYDYNSFLPMQPRLSLGLKIPATYRGQRPLGQGGSVGGSQIGEVRTQVIVDETHRIILPPNTDAVPVFGALLSVPTILSKTMAVNVNMRAEINDNQPRLTQDNERGEVTYFFDSPLRLGFSVVLQSRW